MCMVRCIIVFNRQVGWRDYCHMYTYVFAMPSVDTCAAMCALYTCKHVYHVPEQACLGASHTGPLDGLTLGHQLATHLSHTYACVTWRQWCIVFVSNPREHPERCVGRYVYWSGVLMYIRGARLRGQLISHDRETWRDFC